MLTRARRVGQLLLGPLALGDEGRDLRVEGRSLGCRRGTPPCRVGAPIGKHRQVDGGDRRLQPRDLDEELLRALRGGRLQRERTEPLPHLLLEVAGTLDLDGDPGELELGTVPPALEAAEPGRLLDQLPPLGGLRVEHRLDAPLRDHRAQAAAETDVGEQLDQVEPPDRRPVDEVLALAAAVEPAGDRHLAVGQVGPRPVGVVEEQLDLRRVRLRPARGAGEEHVVGLLGAQLPRAHRAGRPEDRVGDVRLAGPVRPDDHGDARLEADLDRVDERLEAAQLDCLQVHPAGGYRPGRMGRFRPRAPRARAGRRPAPPPSSSARCPCRAPRRRPRRRQ